MFYIPSVKQLKNKTVTLLYYWSKMIDPYNFDEPLNSTHFYANAFETKII